MGDLDLIRPLGLAGVRCAIVTPPGSVPSRSRFTHFAVEGSLGEISDGSDNLLQRLEDFAASQPYPPVLYYQEDDQLLFVSRHRERLARSFRFVVAEATLVEDLVDKGRFHVLAARLGLPLPRTRRVQPVPGASLPDIDLKFPLVAKPLRRRKSWGDMGYKTKAVQVSTSEALHDLWPHWISQGMDLLLQDAIPGPESRIESYHVYVDQEGAIVGEFTGRKIRTFPPSLGYSTALTLTDSEDVLGLGRSVIDKLSLRGVAKLDFKRDPEGELHLLEVNPRFNLWHHLGAVGGVNLPALV